MLWEILPPEFHLLPSEAAVSGPVVLRERDSHQTTGRQACQVHCQQVSEQKLSLPLQHEGKQSPGYSRASSWHLNSHFSPSC